MQKRSEKKFESSQRTIGWLGNKARDYVRVHDLRVIKNLYKAAALPLYRLALVPIYDITASQRHHYTWFRIPKNGTHSIMRVLQLSAAPEVNSSYVPYHRKQHVANFKFSVIRNPWERLVSVYCNKVLMKLMFPECWGKDFGNFIEFVSKQNLKTCDAHIRLQVAMFPVQDVDFIAKMESFDHDVCYILQKLSIQCNVPHIGAVDHEPYQQFYVPRLVNRVKSLYAADIEYGNYEF